MKTPTLNSGLAMTQLLEMSRDFGHQATCKVKQNVNKTKKDSFQLLLKNHGKESKKPFYGLGLLLG